jgi:hypothetical protein
MRNERQRIEKPIRVFDFFSGCGGTSAGLRDAGTHPYQLATPGEYTVSIQSDGFNLTTKDNYDVAHGGPFRDEKAVKRSGELKAGEVKFVIVK